MFNSQIRGGAVEIQRRDRIKYLKRTWMNHFNLYFENK